jgi:hypothetical protein
MHKISWYYYLPKFDSGLNNLETLEGDVKVEFFIFKAIFRSPEDE